MLSSLTTMNSFSSYFDLQPRSASQSRWTCQFLKNFHHISPVVQTHLKQVYVSLLCSLIAYVIGAYLHNLWNIGGLLITFATMGCMYWLYSTQYDEPKRFSLLMTCSLLHGVSFGPEIKRAIDYDPSVIMMAFTGAAIAFACFLGIVMLARRTEYLYLGGLLSFSVSVLFWLQFGWSIFGYSVALFQYELYFGLVVFIGYMVVETLVIIEKAHLGDLHYVKYAFTLFIGFTTVLPHIFYRFHSSFRSY